MRGSIAAATFQPATPATPSTPSQVVYVNPAINDHRRQHTRGHHQHTHHHSPDGEGAVNAAVGSPLAAHQNTLVYSADRGVIRQQTTTDNPLKQQPSLNNTNHIGTLPNYVRSNTLHIQEYSSSSFSSAPHHRHESSEIFFCKNQYTTTSHNYSNPRHLGHPFRHPPSPSSHPPQHSDRYPHDPQPHQQHIFESMNTNHVRAIHPLPHHGTSTTAPARCHRRQHHPYGTPPALPQPQPPLMMVELLPPARPEMDQPAQAQPQQTGDHHQHTGALVDHIAGGCPQTSHHPLSHPQSSRAAPTQHQEQPPLTYCNLYVSKVPRSMNDAELLSHFSPYGATSATVMRDSRNGDSKGFGFVVFPDEASGREGHAAVMRSATGRAFDVFPSRHVQQQAPLAAADRCPSLYIRNIPVAIASEAVAALLGQFGRVLRLALRKDPAGLAVWLCFATFSDVKEADAALVALHNQFRFPGATLPVVVKYDRHQGAFQPAPAIGAIGGSGSPSQATAAAKRKKKDKMKDPPGAEAEACVASANTNTDLTTAAHRRDQQRLRRAVRRARKREQRRQEELNPESGANPEADDDGEEEGDDRDDNPNGGDEGSQDAASLAVCGACEQRQLTPPFPPQALPQQQHASSDAIPPPCNASVVADDAAPPMATGAGPATATASTTVAVAPPASVPQPLLLALALPIFEPLPGASSSSSSSNHNPTATTTTAIVSATTGHPRHPFNRHPHHTQACDGVDDDDGSRGDLTNPSARRSLLIGGKSIPRPPPVVVQIHPKEPQQPADSGSSPTGRHDELPAAFGPATTTTAPSPAAGRRFDGSGSYFDGGCDTGGGSPTGGPANHCCYFSFDVEPPAAPPHHHQDPYHHHRHFSAESAEGILHQRHDSRDMNTSTSYHQQQQQEQPAIGFVFDRRRLSLSGYGGGVSTTTIGGAAGGPPGVGGLGRSGVVIRSRASSYSRLVHSAASGPMSAGPSPTSPNPPLPSPLLPATGTAVGAHLGNLTSPNWTACQKGDAQSPTVAAAAAAHSAYHNHATQQGGSTTVSPGLNGTVGSGSGIFAAGGGLLSVPTQANTAGGLLTPMSLPVAVERPAPDSGLWYRSSPYAGGFEHLFHRGGGSPSASMSSASATNHGSHSATTLQQNHNTAGSRYPPNATPNNDNNTNVNTNAGTSIGHRPQTSTACGAPLAAPAETPHEVDKAADSASVAPSTAASAGSPAVVGASASTRMGMRVVAAVGCILPPGTSNTTPLVEVIATPTVHALSTYERPAGGGEGQQGRGDVHVQPSPFI